MKTNIKYAVFFLLVCAPNGFCESGKTIGDILRNIEKTAKKVKIDKNKTELPKYEGLKQAPVANLSKVKPPSTSKLSRNLDTKEAKLERYTDEEIQQLFDLAQQYKRSQRRGEIWLRLAEAYIDKSKLVEYRLNDEYEKKLVLYQQKKLSRRPKLSLSEAQVYNRKAVQLYEWFIRDFPKDYKMDQAYFFLGYNHFELGDIKKGLYYYQKLIKEKPKSLYIDQSYFAIGEYYFENEKWELAGHNYEQVTLRPQSKLYSFSTYKLAWCQYKKGDINNALRSLEKVILAGRVNESKEAARKIRLADEARKDLVPFFAESQDYKSARGYFEKVVQPKYVNQLIERLAYYYVDTGNRVAARYHFKELIAEDPYAPKAYDYQYQIVNMYFSAGNKEVFEKELFRWVEDYGPVGRWAKANQKNQVLIGKASELVETTLRSFILQTHQTAQNSRGTDSQKLAQNGYELYFNIFGKNEPYKSSQQTANMHFFYGELLFDMGDFSRAAYHYLWVTDNDPKNKYRAKAILNALLALEKKLPSEESIKKIVGDSTDPVPLDKTTKSFAKVAKTYFSDFTQEENAVDIKYKLASLYYIYNHYDMAIRYYMDVVRNHPKSKYSENSANLVLHIYDLKKDYSTLEQVAQQMLQVPEIAQSKFGKKISDIMVRSSFKKAQLAEENKNYEQSAIEFQQFATNYKGTDLALPAKFNAAVNFERSGKLIEALALYIALSKDEPNNKKDKELQLKSLEFSANLYKQIGQYENAATAYESYAVKVGKGQKVADFYFNAAVLREGMLFYTSAIRNYERYYALSQKVDKVEALFQIAQIWEQRNDLKMALRYYSQFIEKNPRRGDLVVEATFKIGTIYARLKNFSKANQWYLKTVSIYQRFAKSGHPTGVSFAAEAKFKLSYGHFVELTKMKISTDPKKQATAIKNKISKIDVLTKELKKVIGFGDPFQVVASIVTLGQANQHMAAALFRIPAPKGGSADQLKQFAKQKEDFAKPFLDKAVESYKSGIDKAYELEAYNQWVEVALKGLNQLDPSKYPLRGERAILTRLPDWLDRNIDSENKEMDKKYEELKEARKATKDQEFLKIISEALTKDANDLYTLNSLGLFYFVKKRYGLSKLVLNRAIEAHKKEPALYNNLGVVLLAEGKMRDSIAAFTLSKKYDPSYPVSATNLGAIYLEFKDYRRALAPMEVGYKITQNDLEKGKDYAIEVANNYALALMGVGNPKKAGEVFDDILDHNVRNPDVLLNYAILLVEYLNKPDKALTVLSKIKFMSEEKVLLNRVKELEKTAYEKKH